MTLRKRLSIFLLFVGSALAQTPFPAATGSITTSGAGCTVGATNCVLLTLPANTSAVSVTVGGVFNATLQFEGSGDSQTTFFNVNGTPQPSGASVSSVTGTGLWLIPTAALTHLRVRASALSSGTATVVMQPSTSQATDSNEPIVINNTPGVTDPCQNPSVLKSSATFSVSSATTTSIVAVSGTKSVYICGGSMTISGSATTADTAQFEYGTGAACSTPTVLSGLFGAGIILAASSTSGINVVIPGGATAFTAPSANGFCVVTAGTVVSVQGYVSFVQQ